MDEAEMLHNMVMGFRVSEIQKLLRLAVCKYIGPKSELQKRALKLLRLRTKQCEIKIRKLNISLDNVRGSRKLPLSAPSKKNDISIMKLIDATTRQHHNQAENNEYPDSGFESDRSMPQRGNMDKAGELKNMVMSFRVSELQKLLRFAGCKYVGPKTELQRRTVKLLRSSSKQFEIKVRQLHKSIEQFRGSKTVSPLATAGKRDLSIMETTAVKTRQHEKRAVNNAYTASGYETDRRMRQQGNMDKAGALKDMIICFRVSELQKLLRFEGCKYIGTKTELQRQVLKLLQSRSKQFEIKVRELYISLDQVRGSRRLFLSAPGRKKYISSVTPTATTTRQNKNQAGNNQFSSLVYETGGSMTQPASIMYSTNVLHEPQQETKESSPNLIVGTFPVHPDVKFKGLPFYELLSELLKPSTLLPHGSEKMQENNFLFHLTPQQAQDIGTSRELRSGCEIAYGIQVQMRFCLMETSCEQEDSYPSGICVKVNNKLCPLPNPILSNKPSIEPKRSSRPVNITPMMWLSSTVANHVTVSWNIEYNKAYVLAIHLVRKHSPKELLQGLKQRGSRHSDCTKGLIKEKLQDDLDSEISTMTLRVSLLCPLGRMRMTTPCRSRTCNHLQCFDALIYLKMNEQKPSWMCPACNKPAVYDNLMIDGYFQEIISSGKLGDGNEIELHQDGSWTSLVRTKGQTQELAAVDDKECVKSVLDYTLVIAESKEQASLEPKENSTVIDLNLNVSDNEYRSDKKVSL